MKISTILHLYYEIAVISRGRVLLTPCDFAFGKSNLVFFLFEKLPQTTPAEVPLFQRRPSRLKLKSIQEIHICVFGGNV